MAKSKSKDIVKHSAAHVLALAVKRLHPEAKVGIGPVTKDGFYYDFNFGDNVPEINLIEIEQTANQIVTENLNFKQMTVGKDEAYNMMLQLGEIFKAELVSKIEDSEVSFYKLGNEFTDLCRGPHVSSTNKIGIIKVEGKEEVHWQDDPERALMIRIHGAVFSSLNEYNEFVKLKEVLKDRDFTKISESLGFTPKIDEKYFFSHKSEVVFDEIKNTINSQFEDLDIKFLSSHNETKFSEVTKLIDANYNNFNRSYKTLPLIYQTNFFSKVKINKTTFQGNNILYRSYINKHLALDFISDGIDKVLSIGKIFSKSTMNVEIYCTNLEDEYVVSISNYLQKNLVSHNKVLSSKVDGIFKIVFNLTDSIDKNWKVVEVNLGSDNNIQVVNTNNKKEEALIFDIHFIVLDIFGFLIEEYKDSIPFKFSPVQIVCIPTSKTQYEFGKEIIKALNSIGFRSELDLSSKSFKSKIRKAENRKIPYIFVVGNKENTNKAVSVRHKGNEIGLVSIQNIKTFIEENNSRNA